MIRIVLADDHALVREGIRSLLELTPDLRIVGEAAEGNEAIRLVAELDPDEGVMDVRLGPRSDVHQRWIVPRRFFAGWSWAVFDLAA